MPTIGMDDALGWRYVHDLCDVGSIIDRRYPNRRRR
jgi:hypothetical protein